MWKVPDEIYFFADWGHKWPLWGGIALTPEHLGGLSPELNERLRNWVKVWQEDLDPVLKVEWPSVEQGRAWIAEGNALVSELQTHLQGRGITVIPRFAQFDPDTRD